MSFLVFTSSHMPISHLVHIILSDGGFFTNSILNSDFVFRDGVYYYIAATSTAYCLETF